MPTGLGVRGRHARRRATCRSSCASPTGPSRTISYVTSGDARFPKETLDISGGGRQRAARQLRPRLGVDGPQAVGQPRLPKARDKGQSAELAAFVKAVRTGGPMPIPLRVAGRHHARPPSPCRPSLVGGAPVTLASARDVSSAESSGWYLRRLSRMGPRRGRRPGGRRGAQAAVAVGAAGLPERCRRPLHRAYCPASGRSPRVPPDAAETPHRRRRTG